MAVKEKKRARTDDFGVKDSFGYMIGDSGNMFVLSYISSFLKVFYTDVLKLAPQKVANLFLLTRLWDAVNDPLWGGIVAKRKPTENGKYRPYIKWIAVPLAVSEAICFINVRAFTDNAAVLLLFAYVTYILFGMLYTGINVPYGSLASVITDDPNGRTMLSTARSVGSGVGGAAPLLLAPFLIYTKVSDGNGGTYNVANAGGMLAFAAAMAVCSIIGYFLCYGTVRERVHSPSHQDFSIKKMYGAMFRSRPFIVLALTGILISGQLQFSSLNQYLYKNYFCNTSLSALGTVAQYLPMAIMIPFMPRLVRRFGKKELCCFGTLFAAAAAVVTFLIKPKPDQPMVFMALLLLIGFGYSFVSITNWAVVTDVIDYQEYTTGIKSESAVYAVYTFCRKLGQTAADYGGLMLLSRVGYRSEVMSNAGYVAGVSEGILFVCTLIPAVVYTLIFLLYRFGYPLSKEKLVPIYEYMHSKHETENESDL